jgi:L-glyceraldehyde 3-phosphate reductase
VAALDTLGFTDGELKEIDKYAQEGNINLWAKSSNDG